MKNFIKNIFLGNDIPIQYHSNFIHLYFEIGWFGVLSGSTVNFISVYATRIGATGLQLGLMGAMSAIVSLLLAIPAGHWLEKNARGRAVFWLSVIYRTGFLLYIPLPWLLNSQNQILTLIGLSFLMGIPLIGLSVGFSALFAESVPDQWRAHAAGLRNVILSTLFMVTSLISGFILNHLVFPLNYQIVFLIGFFGAAMSSYHLYFIKPINNNFQMETIASKFLSTSNENKKTQGWQKAIRADIWETKYKWTMLVMLFFHITQYLALPLFPLFFVRHLNLSDQNLGIGTAMFYLTVLIGSTQLNYLVHKLGHKRVTGWGVVGMALYPGLMAISSLVWHIYAISIIGGLAWAFVGGASANYIIENCPTNDRPAYLAWYNVILNASILIGSVLGPTLADSLGLTNALILFAIGRGMAGFAILKWG